MKIRNAMLLASIVTFPARADDQQQQPSDQEQVSRIASLPVAQCQRDLTKLHDIYGQMKNMSSDEVKTFLQAIVSDIRSRGLQIPPPPPPCSSVHLALESRCGNLSDAESKCQQNGTSR